MKRWTDEGIINALKAWYQIHGDAPTVRELDWYRPDWMPSGATVQQRFGTFGAALEAAGLPRRGRGCPNHRLTPAMRDNHGRILSYADSGGW